MPDFIPVLIIGIIALIGLLLVFGGGSFIVPSRGTTTGSRYFPVDRTIEFDHFEVSYTTGQENVESIKGEISNGVFVSEEKRVGFKIEKIEDVSEVFLNLKNWRSNYYGKIIISLNGKEIYMDTPPLGEKIISFDKSILKENNILEIKAESSGWKIWAPTVYIFDLDVIADYTGKRYKSFDFELTDSETDYMDKARIVVFGEREGTGLLNVMVNGVKVYEGITTIYKDFPVSILKTGNNTIEFSTEPNTRYDISSAQVIVFFE